MSYFPSQPSWSGAYVDSDAPAPHPLPGFDGTTAPTSISSGRKQACRPCRQRKKKCDGTYPACSSCTRWETACVYGHATAHAAYAGQGLITQPTSLTESAFNRNGMTALSASNLPDTLQSAVDEQNGLWNWDPGMGTTFFPQLFLDQASLLSSDAFGHRLPMVPSSHVPEMGHEASHTALNLAVDSIDTANPTPSPGSPMTQARNIPSSLSDVARSQEPTTSHSTGANSPGSSVAGLPSETALPPTDQLEDLIRIFFSQYHILLPCLHQNSFMSRVSRDRFLAQPNALIWAVLAVAANTHSNTTLQACCLPWLSKARELFDASIKTLCHPTETLQAAVWIIFQAYVMADMSEMWVFLGKACRLASLLGWDRVDSTRTVASPFAPAPKDFQEKEERRKTIWALFYLDRAMSSLCGWPVAIDDNLFMVNFPIDDEAFQSSTPDTVGQAQAEPFTTHLPTLVAATSSVDPSSRKPMRLIFKASVLLGRIIVHHNNLHPPSDQEQRATDFACLENALARFCLVAPQPLSSTRQVFPPDLLQVIWLNFLLHTCTVLLYHPTSTNPTPSSIAGNNSPKDCPGFLRCLNAMRSTLRMIKEASNYSIQSLLNPLVVPTYFLCSRFLAISWLESKDQAQRDDIDLILMLLDRVADSWGPLAAKYRTSVLHDLGKTVEAARRMRVGTGSYIGSECA